MIPPPVLRQLTDYLDRRFGVDALWLFGSEARGTANDESDVDLAALFRWAPTPLEILDAEAELEPLAGRPVQVVDLDHVSPILGMQVLRHGELLLDRNPSRRHELFGRTLNLYEDLKIVRREAERMLFERAARAGA